MSLIPYAGAVRPVSDASTNASIDHLARVVEAAEILGITPALCAPGSAEAASNVASSGKRGRRGLGGHARSQTPIGRQQIATYHRSSRLRSLSTWRPRSNTHANRSTRSARLTGRTVASSSRAWSAFPPSNHRQISRIRTPFQISEADLSASAKRGNGTLCSESPPSS